MEYMEMLDEMREAGRIISIRTAGSTWVLSYDNEVYVDEDLGLLVGQVYRKFCLQYEVLV